MADATLRKEIRVAVDVRALQDDEYATKGIGQHSAYVIDLLRGIAGVQLAPYGDPSQRALRHEHLRLFQVPVRGMQSLSCDVYLNLSPLTHDTSFFVAAARRGACTGAVVHDFIPLRQDSFPAQDEDRAAYNYLVRTLGRYDFLVANSWFTESEIGALLPESRKKVVTVHGRSRFRKQSISKANGSHNWRERVGNLKEAEAYIFFGAADDPRKNVDIAIQSASELQSLGLRLVVGGGLSDSTRKRLRRQYPEQFYLADPIILPRLADEELLEVYSGAAFVLVCSIDEGFSLPVAEGIALGKNVIASNIPAHREQIVDPSLLFNPYDVRSLVRAARYALQLPRQSANAPRAYRAFDFDAEADKVRSLVINASRNQAPAAQGLKMVGPSVDKPSGIAVYNKLLLADISKRRETVEYVDVEELDAGQFYAWLFDNQFSDIVYVMGNNNIFHSRCFTALNNVPGACIMHDSRLFEFLLNRHGPYRVADIWNARHRSQPIDFTTVIEWQKDRHLLPYSFLDPLVARSSVMFVHSKILAAHIRETYNFSSVQYLPFALQMTDDEVRFVTDHRRSMPRYSVGPLRLVMLGETEATKGCCEIIFALKMMLLTGFPAELSFVGKSEEPYHTELRDNARRLGIEGRIHFTGYVSRQTYLDYMVAADVIVQLRYPLFGQVSGPVGDAVACGVPVVTTEELAVGTELAEFCSVVPNKFSPLHIATAIRKLVTSGAIGEQKSKINSMSEYVNKLLSAYSRARTRES